MEDIFYWDEEMQNEAMRGATGGGDGVHVLTGPIYVEGAEPGDMLATGALTLPHLFLGCILTIATSCAIFFCLYIRCIEFALRF